MERGDIEEVTNVIYAMYCAKYDLDPAAKRKDYDVDRHEVDDILYMKRIKDDDPLFNWGE